jgi:hypothetical protein
MMSERCKRELSFKLTLRRLELLNMPEREIPVGMRYSDVAKYVRSVEHELSNLERTERLLLQRCDKDSARTGDSNAER